MTQLGVCHLSANLHALASSSSDAVARIRAAPPRPDIIFEQTPDGVPSARIGFGPEQRQLASRRRPLDEAVRLIGTVDIKEAAVFVVAGFGLGYHVEQLARKVGRTGIVIVYEPDIALLRAVLERIDCTPWLALSNVCILTDPDDSAAMGEVVRGLEGLVGLGVTLVQHPPSAPRLGPGAKRFHEQFAGVVDAVKMTVITTLVQVRVTMRNLAQNADVYTTSPGILELAGACAGRPAIVVSAGPSLRRNLALLEDPSVRERCVIIAVQTVLKTLLARNIRPHFVTALDYSEINRRFYEGLTESDVRGITLVVEPKVNPGVPMAWPGAIRCTGDAILDLLLGDSLAGDHGHIPQGATVAHLAYYLARQLGCDPVALIGQDLGFTDGQYYAGHAAIHNVWAGELNEFKSLELLEWQRIVRMGPHLRRTHDVLGREMFTDAQMHSYLAQFETDFRADAAKGLTTIDATEGGVRKQNAAPMSLRDFLARHAATPHGGSIDDLLAAAQRVPVLTRASQKSTLHALRKRIGDVRTQLHRVTEISAKTAITLAEMREHRADQQRVDALIRKVHANAAEVESLTPGFALTQHRAQAAVFNRFRADRTIQLQSVIDPIERQALQITRDLENVRGLQRAAIELREMLDGVLATLAGAPRITRDMPVNEQELESAALCSADDAPVAPAPPRTVTTSAILLVDHHRGGLGHPRPLNAPFAGRPSILAATIDRLLSCAELRDILLASSNPDATLALLSPQQRESGRVHVVALSREPDADRRRAIAVGRSWARHCWRGGLGDLTIFDEAFDPRTFLDLMTEHHADAALVVAPDWCAVDPAMCDELIRRHRENPDVNRLAFSQAVPGLCGCVVSRSLAADLCAGRDAARMVFASIGGVLGYVPAAPLQDLIAHPICLALAGPLRDCGLRIIADSPRMCTALERALAAPDASSESIVAQLVSDAAVTSMPPCELLLARETCDRSTLAQLGMLPARHDLSVVTVGDGTWDPLTSSRLPEITSALRSGSGGAVRSHAIHVRTQAFDAPDNLLRTILPTVDVISIDCLDAGASLVRSREFLCRLLQLRRELLGHGGMGVPWIVPRLLRCDASYDFVEEFINEWVGRCGWAVLDPLSAMHVSGPNERIAALPIPTTAAARFARIRSTL